MRSYLLFGLLIWLFSACSLTANQEKSLNRAIIQYQNAFNKELTILEVSLTHPCLIDAYVSDTLGLKKLFLHTGEEIDNYSISSIEEQGEDMKVKLTFDYLTTKEGNNNSKKIIYALSSNYGKSWFFIDSTQAKYLNCKRFKHK